jgi:hypothetical protein
MSYVVTSAHLSPLLVSSAILYPVYIYTRSPLHKLLTDLFADLLGDLLAPPPWR